MDPTNSHDRAADLGDRVRRQFEQATRPIVRTTGRMTSFIQDHPAVCLMGALAVGYVVARVARSQR